MPRRPVSGRSETRGPSVASPSRSSILSTAEELRARNPKAAGKATIDFTLLGDKKIGGVVDEANVDAKSSTLHDEKFETCVRESMFGVYFDPPPANAEATLNFPITLLEDGGIADDIDDFSNIRDRRNEK